ncbi:hypothetical protein M422DRAFT_259215 [Sphaerobolus stellatus SS14]|uniref:Uncharacterized protein n=1 Tax=Sphaerobolus stellatus (strain SS14) TaxID=990650 RepID=A0A0C9V933_SPHS4|nr:hypothetical protein M422DRAFT_259215 [Sphaerobolus stellatus SS14]
MPPTATSLLIHVTRINLIGQAHIPPPLHVFRRRALQHHIKSAPEPHEAGCRGAQTTLLNELRALAASHLALHYLHQHPFNDLSRLCFTLGAGTIANPPPTTLLSTSLGTLPSIALSNGPIADMLLALQASLHRFIIGAMGDGTLQSGTGRDGPIRSA